MNIRDRIKEFIRIPAKDLAHNPRNWRRHPKDQRKALRIVLGEIGFAGATLVRETEDGYMLIDGHLRQEEVDPDMMVPVLVTDLTEEEADTVLWTFDPLGALADTDKDFLRDLLREPDEDPLQGLAEDVADLYDIDLSDADGDNEREAAYQTLQSKFLIPPFSILDSRQGYWRDRKRAWISLGIESELGRDGGLVFAKSAQNPGVYTLRNKMREKLGYDPSWDEIIAEAEKKGVYLASGTSIFDPVLCEVLYTWYSRKGHRVLDPFAGGSVRGVVAAHIGREYTGVELRAEQVEANIAQLDRFDIETEPSWITGDSMEIDTLAAGEYDMIFSCPPYLDLEKYSDLPNDISNMKYDDFMSNYRTIIAKAGAMLRDNRFAAWVISEVRDRSGSYTHFLPDTIAAFEDAGLTLYNHAILANVASSMPIRVSSQFSINRKVGRLHQNVLVFLKGDWREAVKAAGPIDVYIPEENQDADDNGLGDLPDEMLT